MRSIGACVHEPMRKRGLMKCHALPISLALILLGQGLCSGQSELSELKQKAKAGDPSAQVQVGMTYAMTANPDIPEAMKWFRMAANQGSAQGELHLAAMYDFGLNPQNPAEAVKWYTLAATQGLKDAEYRLGVMYDRGRGVTQDYAVAAEWYTKAARQGRVDSQYRLGEMYEKGQGVKQNFATAMKWYLAAANQQHAVAEYQVGRLYEKGIGTAKNKSEAMAWYQRSSAHGYPDATEALKALESQ